MSILMYILACLYIYITIFIWTWLAFEAVKGIVKLIRGGGKMGQVVSSKVRWGNGNRIKYVTVPKDCDIEVGDYVKMEKLE